MSKKNVWSPQPREKYTVTLEDGTKEGLGVRSAFDESPGLWNLFWLHSVSVDALLDWQDDPAKAPCYSASLNYCMESLFHVCGNYTIERLAMELSAKAFIVHIVDNDCHPPIRVWLDEPEDDNWLDFVMDKVQEARGLVSFEGNLAKVNF